MIADNLALGAQLPIFALARLQPLGDEFVRRYRRMLGIVEPHEAVTPKEPAVGEPTRPMFM